MLSLGMLLPHFPLVNTHQCMAKVDPVKGSFLDTFADRRGRGDVQEVTVRKVVKCGGQEEKKKDDPNKEKETNERLVRQNIISQLGLTSGPSVICTGWSKIGTSQRTEAMPPAEIVVEEDINLEDKIEEW